MNTGKDYWPAPAKLNLMLHITGRRKDGYHNLQTVFQFLDYGDSLQIQLRDDVDIAVRGSPRQIQREDDLVYRAARLLQSSSGVKQGANIRLHKILPLGAGLGGGSSDAASCLVALNYLWQLQLSVAQLCEIGLKLGADVPVFVQGQASFAEGVGEKITPISLNEPWFLVLTPPVQVSTGEVFCKPELTRDCSAIKICDLSRQQWKNVCTPVVVAHYPEVGQAIGILSRFSPARMSGTGASVFAAFEQEAEANRVLAILREKYLPEDWNSFLARGVNESPLRCFLNKGISI